MAIATTKTVRNRVKMAMHADELNLARAVELPELAARRCRRSGSAPCLIPSPRTIDFHEGPGGRRTSRVVYEMDLLHVGCRGLD